VQKKKLELCKTEGKAISTVTIHGNTIDISWNEFINHKSNIIIINKIKKLIGKVISSKLCEDKVTCIDLVLLIGGSSHVPIVRKTLEDIFGQNKIKDPQKIDKQLMVTAGAAVVGAVIKKKLNYQIKFLLLN